MRRVLAAAALVVLGGCVREEDPAKAGFFSGLGNAVSGTYERRVDERQQELSRTEELKREMAARAAESDRRRGLTDLDLRDRESRLAALDGDLSRLQRRVDQLKRQRTGDRARLGEAERELADLRRDRAAGAAAIDDTGVRDLEQRTRTIDRAISALGQTQ